MNVPDLGVTAGVGGVAAGEHTAIAVDDGDARAGGGVDGEKHAS